MPLNAAVSTKFEVYEDEIAKAREQFAMNPALSVITDPDADPKLLTAFFLYFSALGVAMTEPVDSWITRAGEASKSKGFSQIGQALCLHAKHEAGHHLMMIQDTKALVNYWNSKYEPKLDAEELLAHPLTDGVRNYAQLHEDVIASEAPFTQITIELEIENLSLTVAPPLIENCKKVLGSEIAEGLSFLEEHAAIDVSHTHFNEKQLDKFLAEHPEQLDLLLASGQKALEAYGAFVSDCVGLAQELVAFDNG